MLVVGMATPGLNVHGNCIVILAKVMIISLALIINFVVVLTSTRIHVNVIMD
jgi:hypothetical protein